MAGGICYDANGINTDIYLSGTDPEGGTSSGFLRAPGGGGGGGGVQYVISSDNKAGGGGGGAGINIGLGAIVSGTDGNTVGVGGVGGGAVTGNGAGGNAGNWGQNGQDGEDASITNINQPITFGASGGAAGKGIVKSGGIVNVYGDTPTNFINGGGDTPNA